MPTNPSYGMSAGATLGGSYQPNQAANQALAAQQNAAQAASRALQQRQLADQDAEQQRIIRDRAAQTQLTLMQDNNNPRTTNGMEMQISNGGSVGGGSSSSSRGGMQVGGGTYPDISGLQAQLQALNKPIAPPQRVGAPQVPQGTSGFAHAKDVAGRSGNKALEAFRNQMTARGISDSGMASMGEANILGNVARQGSDAEYEHQALNTARQWDANKMAYQGDLGQNEMEYASAVNQRNSSMQAILQLMNRLY